jgi:hypothetical protein
MANDKPAMSPLDKSKLEVVPLAQADDELEYWLQRTMEERCRGIEQIRRALYGYSDPVPRLSRVLEIVDPPRG